MFQRILNILLMPHLYIYNKKLNILLIYYKIFFVFGFFNVQLVHWYHILKNKIEQLHMNLRQWQGHRDLRYILLSWSSVVEDGILAHSKWFYPGRIVFAPDCSLNSFNFWEVATLFSFRVMAVWADFLGTLHTSMVISKFQNIKFNKVNIKFNKVINSKLFKHYQLVQLPRPDSEPVSCCGVPPVFQSCS